MDSENSEGRLLGRQMRYYIVLFYTVFYPVTSVVSPGIWEKEKKGRNANLQSAVKLSAESGAGGSTEIMCS